MSRTRSWLALGPGVAWNLQGVGGPGGSVEWVLQRNANVLMVRGSGGTEIDLAGDANNRGVGDYGVLVGRSTSRKGSHVFAAIGVGKLVGGCGNSRVACPDIVSVPVVLEGGFHPARVFGMAGQLFANLNTRSPMVGTAIVLEVGWFGKK